MNNTENLNLLLEEIKAEQDGKIKKEKTIELIMGIIIKLSRSHGHDDLFWGALMTYVKKVFDEKLPAPMAVRVSNNNIELVINSYKWEEDFTAEMIEAIIKHEGYHILMNHLGLFKEMLRHSSHNIELFNIATDCEINQYLVNLPENCVDIEYVSSLTGIPVEEIPKKAGSLVYYNLLLENKKNNDDNNSGNGNGKGKNSKEDNGTSDGEREITQIDSHDEWGQPSAIKEEDLVKDLVAQAVSDVKRNRSERGLFSSDLSALIDKINAPAIVPWQRLIKTEMGKQVYGKKKSINRLNRRLPYDLTKKGILNDYVKPIIVAMDVSGSISKDDLALFYNEVVKLSSSLHIPVEIIHFDTEIKTSYIVKNKRDINFQVTGFGGTSFQSVFDHLKENKYDKESMLFIFSDGYGESSINHYGYKKHFWILTNDGKLSVKDNTRQVFQFDK